MDLFLVEIYRKIYKITKSKKGYALTVMGFGHAPTLTTLTKSVTGLYLFRISPASVMNDDVHVLIK